MRGNKDRLSERLMDAFLGETPSVAWGELLREASIELRTPPDWWDAMHEAENRLSSAVAEVDCFNVAEALAIVRKIIDDNIPAGRPGKGSGNKADCNTCEHKKRPEGGWCYMFREEPEITCRKHTNWLIEAPMFPDADNLAVNRLRRSLGKKVYRLMDQYDLPPYEGRAHMAKARR